MRYSIAYLPIADNDIRSAAMYIAVKLNAPLAAANLLREIRGKVNALRDMPYRYQEYRGEPRNETRYRVMPIKNYIVFYTVIEESKTVEVHRVLYAMMDFEALLD